MIRSSVAVAAGILWLALAAACGSGDEDGAPGSPLGGPDAFILYRSASGAITAQNLMSGDTYTQEVDFNSEVIVAARCSADGTRIGYLKQKFSETTRQLVVRGENAPDDPIAIPSTSQGMTWAPDAERVAISDYDGFTEKHKISVLDIASGESREIATGSDYVGALTWSPDGERFAYFVQTLDGSETNIFSLPADGGEAEPITTSAELSWYDPDWAPDGSKLLAAGLDGELFQLYEIDPDGVDEPVRLTDSEIFKRGAQYSPDGSLIAYTGSIIQPAVARVVDSAALHSFGIFLLNSDGSDERAFTADPRLNPGAAVDPFLDAYLLGWCAPGPWLDDLWVEGAPETPPTP